MWATALSRPLCSQKTYRVAPSLRMPVYQSLRLLLSEHRVDAYPVLHLDSAHLIAYILNVWRGQSTEQRCPRRTRFTVRPRHFFTA